MFIYIYEKVDTIMFCQLMTIFKITTLINVVCLLNKFSFYIENTVKNLNRTR